MEFWDATRNPNLEAQWLARCPEWSHVDRVPTVVGHRRLEAARGGCHARPRLGNTRPDPA
jgi:hypothetical protein